MKKVLITGSTGMLGSDLIRTFNAAPQYDIYGLSRTYSPLLAESKQYIIDLAEPSQISRIDISPDVIIHTAAITDLNFCENNPRLAELVNSEATGHLAGIAGKHTLFIYISTDSIFDGKEGGYNESDLPNPLNIYARSKLEGEKSILRQNKGMTTILRTNIYGFHVPMKNSLAEWAYREWSYGKKICGFSDIIFNAVFTYQLATIIKFMIDEGIGEQILNVGSNTAISKYAFLKKFREILGFADSFLEGSLSDRYPAKIERPRNTSLNTSLLSKYCSVPDFESGIREWINHANACGLLNKEVYK